MPNHHWQKSFFKHETTDEDRSMNCPFQHDLTAFKCFPNLTMLVSLPIPPVHELYQANLWCGNKMLKRDISPPQSDSLCLMMLVSFSLLCNNGVGSVVLSDQKEKCQGTKKR